MTDPETAMPLAGEELDVPLAGEVAADATPRQDEGSETAVPLAGEALADATPRQDEGSETAVPLAGADLAAIPPAEDGAEAGAVEPGLGDLAEPASPLEFVDVVVALPSSYPVVILREVDSPARELHIPVGMAEGVAIGYAARQLPTPKPLTHALFVDALVAFGLAVEVVRITDVVGRAYFAEVVLSGPGGTRVLTCRPSDGICLALRSLLPVPITATARVLELAGIRRD